MNKVHYQEPSMEGLGLVGMQEDAFSSMAGSIHDLVSQINRALKDAHVVYLPGQGRVPLDEALQQVVPAGTIAAYHGTLAEARRLRGWRVADGGSGTPDLLGKMVKFISEGTNESGGEGGSATHAHAAGTGSTTELNTAITVDNENAHTHTQGATGETSICHRHENGYYTTYPCPAEYFEVCDGSGSDQVAKYSHCHRYAVDTSMEDCCHSHTNPTTGAGSAHSHGLTNDPHTHDLAGNFSVAETSSYPPYWEGIPIIKL